MASTLGGSSFSLLCIILSLPFLTPVSLGPLATVDELVLADVADRDRLARQLELAAVLLGDGVGDGKAQTGALSHGLRREKWLKSS